MAVVERKRKKGSMFYAVNDWQGKPASEKIGSRRREAEIRDREMKREIKAGTYKPKSQSRAQSFEAYAKVWKDTRRNSSIEDEWRWIRLHVLPHRWFAEKPIAEHTVGNVKKLIQDIQAIGKLSPKSVINLHGVLHLIYRDAGHDELIVGNPADIPPGILDHSESEERDAYSVTELVVLIRNAQIAWPLRVLNTLCFLGGFRMGEACGLRVKDLDMSTRPLWAIDVNKQYGGTRQTKDGKTVKHKTKTKRARVVPVHPELQATLEHWLSEGFELWTGRKPTEDDFLVPRVGPRAKTAHWTRSTFHKAFVRACKAVGIKPKTVHSTRHTFITLARRLSGRKDLVEKITHNAKGDMIDRYTHFDWMPLCEVVLSIDLDVHPDVHSPRGITGNRDRLLPGAGGANSAKAFSGDSNARSSIPGASTTFPQETSHSVNSRQEKRQESTVNLRSLTASNNKRRRRLLALAEAEPDGARPGLALCDALDAAYRVGGGIDHDGKLLVALKDAAESLGLCGTGAA